MIEADEREAIAQIVERTLAHIGNFKDSPDARMAITIAARAVRRGRHLTSLEKMENLRQAMRDFERDEVLAARTAETETERQRGTEP